MILDATAGNRAIWKNKNPLNVVFMDKETGLAIPPDVFAIWQKLPFRNNVFETVIFDPPHDRFSPSSVHMNPKGWHSPRIKNGRKIGGTFWGSLSRSWAGVFFRAGKEFHRVAKRLCFKWNDTKYPLEKPLSLFEDWQPIQIKEHHSKKRRGKTNTYWVTMIHNTLKEEVREGVDILDKKVKGVGGVQVAE